MAAGVFINAFGEVVGDKGCYIGLGISPAFIYYYLDEGFRYLDNVKFNLNKPDCLCLPQHLKGKIDMFFMSATYHHLDDVNGTLSQIYDYLKPGGKLIVIDFRKPDKYWYKKYGDNPKYNGTYDKDTYSNSGNLPMFIWMKGHIRFTEKEAINEIVYNGFRFDRNVFLEYWKYRFIHCYTGHSFL